MPERYRQALQLAEQLALEAGALLRAEFHRPGGPEGERGHAPVDERVEWMIRRALRTAFPTWGYRGEETRPHELPHDADGHIWLVDPNDGTAAFIRGQRGSAVSIGLLRDGVPVLGVVYAPCAPDSAGDLLAWAEGCGPLLRNGRRSALLGRDAFLDPGQQVLDEFTVVIASDGAERRPLDNLRAIAPARFRALPSIAYRLALAAAGEGVGVSLHTPGDWDYGAGHALLRGAGLAFLDERGAEVSYTYDGESHVGRCFGGPPALAAELGSRDWSDVFRGSPPPWPDPALPFDFVRLRRGEAIADADLLSRGQGAMLGMLMADAMLPISFWQGGQEERVTHGRTQGYTAVNGRLSAVGERVLLLARAIDAEGRYDERRARQALAWWRSVTGANEVPEETNAQYAGAEPLGLLVPVAIWGHRLAPPALVAVAESVCRLTGADEVTTRVSALVAVVLAHAIRAGGSFRDLYGLAWDWARRDGGEGDIIEVLYGADHPERDPLLPAHPALGALQTMFKFLRQPEDMAAVHLLCMSTVSVRDGAAALGGLIGAARGYRALPADWSQLVLSRRPIAGLPHVKNPRPRPCWPVDALALAERLLVAGRHQA